jgi:hypothetical protein
MLVALLLRALTPSELSPTWAKPVGGFICHASTIDFTCNLDKACVDQPKNDYE